jgi:energy-coupling factor transporter ATP-binding protein EcfA2
MELLESFVAGGLVQRIRSAGSAGAISACTSFRGAVLFVDISDYTALAEVLCSQGSDGIERLGETLNLAFRNSLSAVHDTDGEIACFAGDAFLAYWSADGDQIGRAVQQARRCAALLHAASQNPGPASTIHAPTLHIGLSAGEMWAARLGGDERWQLLLAGPAVRDACAAAARATAGETVVSPPADQLATSASNESSSEPKLHDADHAPASDSPALEVLSHVPKRVQAYAGAGFSAWIPQRRNICALFIRIDGLDETAADALSRHQAVVTSLHSALRPYTGAPGTLLLDDKGLVFTLCLGMPHDAHADDALRAVRAGLAVEAELNRLGLGCAIGIASGPGVCMPLGGPARRHYWAVGRFMHVAGRLMEAAGRGLLCTEEVADQVRRVVSLSPERPLMLKGLRWPVHPFRIREATALETHTETVFGREEEQATLERLLNGFESHQGAFLWMVGEAGLGKTTLVRHLQQMAAHRNIECLSGGAGSVEIDVAYAAWRPVFASLLGTADVFAHRSQSERRALLGDIRHPELAPLINAVVPGLLDESSLVRSLSGQARADATSRVLSEILGAHATSRFLLILEDCHWMDSASWRLVLRIAQDYPQAFIVLTSRPSTESQELGALRRLDQFTDMRVSPLRSNAIESIVESVLGNQTATDELRDAIIQRSVGNPLFAREYALLLTTQSPGRGFAGNLTAPSQSSVRDAVPVTVQSLIASRLDALPPSEDLALKAASVIGDRFDVGLMTGVYPGNVHVDALDPILTNLAERQLIVQHGLDGGAYAFQHALIREVTYGQLTGDQRRDLHRRVAETLEHEYDRDLRPHFASLAHHWSHAEVPASTIRYSDLAASQALSAGAFEEADRWLSKCIEVSAKDRNNVSDVDRIRWYRQVGDARHGMGQLESRSAAAHQALRLAGRTRPHTPAGLVAQAGVRVCGMAVRRLFRSRRRDLDAAKIMDIARAYRHSAEVCYFNNDMIGMICDSVGAVAFASHLPPSAVLAGASTELGGILSVAGLRRIGERILQRAIAMAEAADDQAAQAYAHMISCLYYVGHADWESAERSAQRCQELCEPMDDRVNWTNAQAVRFWMSHYRSHDAAANEAAIRLRDRASETGNRQHRAWALRCQAVCALRRDEPADATTHLQAALDCLGETAALNERIPTLGMLALAQLRSGHVWSARATAKEALAQVERVKRLIGYGTLEGYSCLLTVALDAFREERLPEWHRGVRECLRVLRRYRKSFPLGEGRYQLYSGEYARLSGSISAARRCYRRGEAAAARLGMPWDVARCREGLQMVGS